MRRVGREGLCNLSPNLLEGSLKYAGAFIHSATVTKSILKQELYQAFYGNWLPKHNLQPWLPNDWVPRRAHHPRLPSYEATKNSITNNPGPPHASAVQGSEIFKEGQARSLTLFGPLTTAVPTTSEKHITSHQFTFVEHYPLFSFIFLWDLNLLQEWRFWLLGDI